MRQRSRLIIVLLATVFWVAGCSPVPNDDPKPTPTVTVAPAPSPSSTDTEPVDDVPEPAPLPLPEYPSDLTLEDTAENAVRAADYFVEVINYTQSTGETQLLREISVDTCNTCNHLIEVGEERSKQGGYLVGSSLTFDNTYATRTDDDLAWVVRGVMSAVEGTEVIDGVITRTFRAQSEDHFRLGVQLLHDKWVLLVAAFGSAP